MLHTHANVREPMRKKHKSPHTITDHVDILTEVLQRLDGRSLSVAACVCRQWCSIVRNDSLWEHLCFRKLSVGSRSVVMALGGYRRLYMVCVRPLVSRLKERRVWDRNEMELTLSLFCVEYYERLLGGGVAVAGGAKSLKFLCEAVNVRKLENVVKR
ncbi:putative F-box domain-containing protein [Helianthus annuus]|uniref:F-box domain-containing protein n=1 Tax=Helianthus annuus TaxID=4232 RepID=A0A251SM54_HELAN|nr:F-box protein SNE [Helianthus annuus]KAF5770981.1 putative F-box domain-containing protein [Helianthus annuus]KAJ0465837.1 putative F-box protein SNE [Helianthus annuus]KAJ0470750.1 putative F-box domain-containing protein [Helianthus annuus]KAJ0487427.1 putative F-box protein SNE [Helianthus annuus]KAJ0657870.1 putative F-box protein SNE [Helianthus annuus]